MTHLGIIFVIVAVISLAFIIWIELDKKHFKDIRDQKHNRNIIVK